MPVALDEEGFHSLIGNLRRKYSFQGAIASDFIAASRHNLLLLRMGIEFAARSGAPIVSTQIPNLFEEYLRSVLETFEARRHGVRHLLARLGDLLYGSDAETVPMPHLEHAEFAFVDELRAMGIIRTYEDEAIHLIGFQHVVVAFHVASQWSLRLETRSEAEITALIGAAPIGGFQHRLLWHYYLSTACENKRGFDRDAFEWCMQVLAVLESLLADRLPFGSRMLDGAQPREVGIAAVLDREGAITGWGVAKVRSDWRDRCLLLPSVGSWLELRKQLSMRGAGRVGWGGVRQTPRDAACDVLRDLASLALREAKLDSPASSALSHEALQVLCFELKLSVASEMVQRGRIELAKIAECVIERQLTRALEESLLSARIKDGTIRPQTTWPILSYSYKISSDDRRQIAEKAKTMARDGIRPESVNGSHRPHDGEERIETLLASFREQGIAESELLPWVEAAYRSKCTWYLPTSDGYHPNQLKAICALHQQLRWVTDEIMERNFPRSSLLYKGSTESIRILVACSQSLKDVKEWGLGAIGDGIPSLVLDVRRPKGYSGAPVRFVESASAGIEVHDYILRPVASVDCALGTLEIEHWCAGTDFGLDDLSSDTLGRTGSDRFAPLRRHIYRMIRRQPVDQLVEVRGASGLEGQ